MRGFKNINPIALTIYFLLVTIIPMLCLNPVCLMLLFLCAAFLRIIYSKSFFKEIAFYLVLLIILAIINPIFSHRGNTVLFVLNDMPITLEASVYGVVSATMIISVLICFSTYSDIMTSDKLLYLFGAFSKKTALILSMSLRFIPLLKRQAKAINDAQKTMGIIQQDSISDNIRSKISVFSALISWALENGITTADSMNARGYESGKKSRYKRYSFTAFDVVFSIISVLLFIISLLFAENIAFACYPAISFADITVKSFICYLSYGILSFLPIFIEVKECLKWKYLQSKI